MNFNVLLWLELAKKFVVGGWLGVVVFKTIIVFSLAEAEQKMLIKKAAAGEIITW